MTLEMIPGFVTVRSASFRLPDKCFLTLTDTRDVLTHVLMRCYEFRIRPIVVTTDDEQDDRIQALCNNLNVVCHRCVGYDPRDKMRRWLHAAVTEGDIERFVTIDCDDPFFEPTLVRGMYDLVRAGHDFAFPDMRAYLGSHTPAVSVEALKKCIDNLEPDQFETEHIENHVQDDMKTIVAQVPDVDPIEQGLRLTLDYPEDYWQLKTVMRILGPMARRHDIIGLFKQNPHMRFINQFRNADWYDHRGTDTQ